LSSCNPLDRLVKELELKLVLPKGSVFCSRRVYLVFCNLCKGNVLLSQQRELSRRQAGIGLTANLAFPSGLNAGAPSKED
jgi:hypothetical protein